MRSPNRSHFPLFPSQSLTDDWRHCSEFEATTARHAGRERSGAAVVVRGAAVCGTLCAIVYISARLKRVNDKFWLAREHVGSARSGERGLEHVSLWARSEEHKPWNFQRSMFMPSLKRANRNASEFLAVFSWASLFTFLIELDWRTVGRERPRRRKWLIILIELKVF